MTFDELYERAVVNETPVHGIVGGVIFIIGIAAIVIDYFVKSFQQTIVTYLKEWADTIDQKAREYDGIKNVPESELVETIYNANRELRDKVQTEVEGDTVLTKGSRKGTKKLINFLNVHTDENLLKDAERVSQLYSNNPTVWRFTKANMNLLDKLVKFYRKFLGVLDYASSLTPTKGAAKGGYKLLRRSGVSKNVARAGIKGAAALR